MVKIHVKTEEGIEFEAFPKDAKEWKRAFADIRAISIRHTAC